MIKLLITGGAGFIGSNLTKRLLETGQYDITCIDNFDPYYSRQIKRNNIEEYLTIERYKLIEGDIRNKNDLNRIGEIDMVVHFAAKVGVRDSIRHPRVYQDVNVRGTQNLLEFAIKKKVKKIILASSSSVYGINENIPWSENETLLPINSYGCSKLSAEYLGHAYSHLYDISFFALRFFTVYGPFQRPDLAIHKFFNQIIKNEPISVYGDGSSLRDYTYISDVIDGIEAALKYKKSNYEIINLGSSDCVTINKLINCIEEICNKKAIINYYPRHLGEGAITLANIAKAQKLLDYDPKIKLETGLRKFYDWFTLQNP